MINAGRVLDAINQHLLEDGEETISEAEFWDAYKSTRPRPKIKKPMSCFVRQGELPLPYGGQGE